MRLNRRVEALEQRSAPEGRFIVLHGDQTVPEDLRPEDQVLRIVYVKAVNGRPVFDGEL